MSVYIENEITDSLVLRRINQLRGVYPGLNFWYGYESYNPDAGLFDYVFLTNDQQYCGLTEIHITGDGKIVFLTENGDLVIIG